MLQLYSEGSILNCYRTLEREKKKKPWMIKVLKNFLFLLEAKKGSDYEEKYEVARAQELLEEKNKIKNLIRRNVVFFFKHVCRNSTSWQLVCPGQQTLYIIC